MQCVKKKACDVHVFGLWPIGLGPGPCGGGRSWVSGDRGWTIVGKLPLVLQFKNGVFDAECLQVHDYRRVAAARETNIIDMFQKLEGQPFLNMLASFQPHSATSSAIALCICGLQSNWKPHSKK